MSPDQTILFTITIESINEMLQLKPDQNITPLSTRDLLDRFPKIPLFKIAQLFQNFIMEEKHIPEDPPPYMSSYFSQLG